MNSFFNARIFSLEMRFLLQGKIPFAFDQHTDQFFHTALIPCDALTSTLYNPNPFVAVMKGSIIWGSRRSGIWAAYPELPTLLPQ